MDGPSASVETATVVMLAATSPAARATASDWLAVCCAVLRIRWAVFWSAPAEDATRSAILVSASSKVRARSIRPRLRPAAAALRATMALISSTARPTIPIPISSPRRPSGIAASPSPRAMRRSAATRR